MGVRGLPGRVGAPATIDLAFDLAQSSQFGFRGSTSQEGTMSRQATAAPGKTLIDPKNHALVMIDHQSQMAFATKSIDAVMLRNNAALIAHAARIFDVPTILTTVAEKTFSGPMFDEIKAAHPKANIIDRTTMNTWEDRNVIDQFNKLGKTKVVFA